MRGNARWMTAGAAGLALALAALVGPRGAADDAKTMPKEVTDGVLKIADLLAKNKDADVSKEAAELKKVDLKFPMRLFKLRKNSGLGVGKAGDVPEKMDGIERQLEEVGDGGGIKDFAALQEMGYRTAAIAAVSEAKAPAKAAGKKNPKDWVAWSAEMRKAGLELAEAAKAKNAAGVQKAAATATKTCTKCHDVFRDDE